MEGCRAQHGEALRVTGGILRDPRLGIGVEETASMSEEFSSLSRLPGSGSLKNNCFTYYGCCNNTTPANSMA